MTYISICEEDMAPFKRIARALEGIESKMAPAKVIEYGPETVDATRKLLADIMGGMEDELRDHMRKACAEYKAGNMYNLESLYTKGINDFMKIFCKALDKIEDEMKKEGKE